MEAWEILLTLTFLGWTIHRRVELFSILWENYTQKCKFFVNNTKFFKKTIAFIRKLW